MTKSPKEIAADLEALAGKATPGPWEVGESPLHRGSILVDGVTDTYNGPVKSSIAMFDLVEATDSEGRHWYTSGDRHANVHLTVAYRNNHATIVKALGEVERMREALTLLVRHCDDYATEMAEKYGDASCVDFNNAVQRARSVAARAVARRALGDAT